MPISAQFGLRLDPDVVREAECTAAESVGDFVCISDDPPNGYDIVAKADPSDFNKMPAVGVIINKTSPTKCLVQWYGETPDIFTGLASGEYYFVGSDSKVSDVPPAPTVTPLFSQWMGVATAPTRLYVRPNDHMVRRVP